MDTGTLLNLALVMVFVLVGGVFAATELALVSLRESQLGQMERSGSRGRKVAELARDPNTFLAAVQIGVTVAGFLSAAYGASTLAPDVAPSLEALGLSPGAASSLALVGMTLLIAYLSLVFGELVPKRFALQKSGTIALLVAPPLSRFATLMRPVIWLLSLSTNVVVRLLGGNPHATSEEMTEDELRDLVGAHESLEDDERQILQDVFTATDRTLREVMRPRGAVDFLDGGMSLAEAAGAALAMPHSRYPVTRRRSSDDVLGFVHVRDLLAVPTDSDAKVVADIVREIPVLPSTNRILPAMAQMRSEGVHIALVVDEYGGTDGIVTLEDIIEVEELTGLELLHESGHYSTVAGLVLERLGHIPQVGETVDIGPYRLTVTAVDGRRIDRVTLTTRPSDEPSADGADVEAERPDGDERR
ncbi:hemolysin family protein [Aeromicrobium sp. REDSEA-S32_B7]|uniref:hemolysin family protein n=1 Tax=Aeromicrobium sp. REDSEA-S32_B7 TaxID=1811526 RepID=UPI000B2423C4|nr:hemolysin family protein [Aeromicrobium sp. REDSEA-S32_B7]